MNAFDHAERLHRLVKHSLDSGTAASLEEAEAQFRGYRLQLEIGENAVNHPAHQTALLTAVALARRVFLGGVTVSGPVATPLRVPFPLGPTLADALRQLGADLCESLHTDCVLVTIGRSARPPSKGIHLRPVYAGWRAGVVPGQFESVLDTEPPMPLAPMLAAALTISEAYFHVRAETAAAGRRSIGLSLWRPEQLDWTKTDDAPRLRFLPSRLWLIGLGHLGQAYLWALGLLPYPTTSGLELVLQDVDVVTPATESTSILSDANTIGLKKTRAMAAWAERRGFRTTLQERRFDASFTRQEDEPALALCGLDNALGRRALDRVGFKLVVEAGLGRGHRDFRSMRLHTLPGSRPAAEIWKGDAEPEDLTGREAYRKLVVDGSLDRCGVTLLAGKAIGAPFVGSIAACLAVSEVLRLLHGGILTQLIDLNLESVEHRTVVGRSDDFGSFNPGFVTLE
jgi:hypothetical protein